MVEGQGGGGRDGERSIVMNSEHKYMNPMPSSAPQRRATTFMSKEDIAAGKKSTWNELEITGKTDKKSGQ